MECIMEIFIAKNFMNYRLLDSGNGKKLESIDDFLVERPCPQALWTPRLKDNAWNKIEAKVIRKKDGGGEWKFLSPDAEKKSRNLKFLWKDIQNTTLNFPLTLTSFGHTGIFFEQPPIWEKLQTLGLEFQNIRNHKSKNSPLKFLNLFGYSGGASVAMAALGFEVYHLDSSKGALKMAEKNFLANNIPSKNIHLILQDAMEFLKYAQKKNGNSTHKFKLSLISS